MASVTPTSALPPSTAPPSATNGDVEMTAPSANGDDEEEDPNKVPDDAVETLYIHNLNESVRIPILKETLLNLFKSYKPIAPVIAHRNLRMRGQAFISFPDRETAHKAKKEVAGFPLYGRPLQISFSRTNTDAAVSKFNGDEALAAHKAERAARKKISRRKNPLRQKAQAKLKAAAADSSATGQPIANAPRRTIQMPDEYLPPNKVLFLQNLPEGTTKEDLQDVFEQHPNLIEVRLIPTKRDIAFVEYADEASSTVAKDALHNFKIDGETKMKVTYARK
ncbi:hypothetical protein FFLO_05130 [Filobasidium floriforme]|uniref:RRM domain-containing protein n=1 Tax=Filobasidium floriforme TaxID=5210 RepID=A0A8K0NP87_9TREE|nr:hypothetical protein FFLO_05130 [Filobasidium floriforme]